MPGTREMQFTYKAKQGPQKIVEGVIEAETAERAVAKILERGLTPLDVRCGGEPSSPERQTAFKLRFSPTRRVPAGEIVLFTRQISDLLSAGVPILRALQIIEHQIKHPVLKEHVLRMIAVVKDGGAFSAALARCGDVFPLMYVNMVRSGEVAGNLDVVMSRLADFTEKDQEVKSQIATSLMYPALILFIGGVTVFVLMTWVIPKITVIFEDLNQTLPLPTVILMKISGFFVRFWWMVLGAGAAGAFYGKQFCATPKGKGWRDGVTLKIPLLGDFITDAQLGRFARTLGTLLESGVDIITALESVGLVMDNAVLKEEVRQVALQVRDGQSLTGAVKGRHHFPETVVSMIAVGEESGQMEQGLYKLADYHERRSRRFMKRISALIEPLLILGLGAVVFFVVMAMLMPIFQMNMVFQ